jgi:peptide/nickel transport system substrate-binding protein
MRVLGIGLVCAAAAAGCAVEPEVATLRIAYPHELVTMDPQAHSDTVTRTVLAAVYESLVSFEPGLQVRAGLADRWTTPDNYTWHLHIREGVHFHDGRLLTPADAVASIERARGTLVSGHQLEEISNVRELPDEDRIIEITTGSPAPLLLTRLESVPVVPIDFDPDQPVGTGPYEWDVGSVEGPIVLKRWRGYWAGVASYPAVSIQFVPFQEDVASLIHRGKLDVVASVPYSFVRDHRQVENWRVIASPAVATTYLGLNSTVPLLADIRVRRAIALAIDRPRLVASIFPESAATAAFSLVPPEVFGYSPDHRRTAGDPVRARQLLNAAGGQRGEPLRLASAESNSDVADHVIEDLVAIGLEVEKELLPYEVFYRRVEDASCDLFLFNWTYRFADASKFLDTFVRSRDPARGFGTFNGAGLADPEIDRLIESAVIEPVAGLRLEKLQDAVAMVGEQYVYLPLFKPANLALVENGVEAGTQGLPMLRPQDFRPAR